MNVEQDRAAPPGRLKSGSRPAHPRHAASAVPAASPSPLAPILEHLRSRPSRTWSIVITVFGDAVVPRGGSLGMGSLLDIFAGMGIGSGVVRTAVSRLAADDWLQSKRVGRSSFYRLTRKGQESFAAAAERVYGTPPQEWDGRFHLILPEHGTDQDAARAALEESGFGNAGPEVWIAPTTRQVPAEAAPHVHIEGCMSLETAKRLAARVWPLAETAAAYGRFLEAFRPLLGRIGSGVQLSDLDALVARILLIHEYRRVVLRDPLLPPALLPDGWAGVPARELCREAYQALLPGSECWLSQNGQTEDGPLPPSEGLQHRFGSALDGSGARRLGTAHITKYP